MADTQQIWPDFDTIVDHLSSGCFFGSGNTLSLRAPTPSAPAITAEMGIFQFVGFQSYGLQEKRILVCVTTLTCYIPVSLIAR